MAALDFSSLKAYVSGGAPRALPSSTVLLDVVHSLIQQRFAEIPFDLHSTVEDVKAKVYQLTGTSPDYQELHLGGPTGPTLAPPQAPLYSFGLVGGGGSGGVTSLYVKDLDPHALGRGGGLHDVSGVKKYVMSDEEYAKRDNTYRAFKLKQKEKDPTWRSIYEKGNKAKPGDGSGQEQGNEGATEVAVETEAEVRSRIPLQARCQITPGERRGTVKYVGLVPELRVGNSGSPLVWIGVALDEPLGKHSGEVGGHRYFTCSAKHGSFIRPANVQVGDFPERDPFEDDDDEEAEGEQGTEKGKAAEAGTDASLYEEI